MPRNPNAERDNPCLKEQELSYKCLSKSNYDREACEVYFANYKNCKDFWHKIRSDRRAKAKKKCALFRHSVARSISCSYLPPVEEREAIKAEYMKTKPKDN